MAAVGDAMLVNDGYSGGVYLCSPLPVLSRKERLFSYEGPATGRMTATPEGDLLLCSPRGDPPVIRSRSGEVLSVLPEEVGSGAVSASFAPDGMLWLALPEEGVLRCVRLGAPNGD